MQQKEPIVINYNDKTDTVTITVNRETTPKLFEARVQYIMKALNLSRQEAEAFCDKRADWNMTLALIFDDTEGDIFAIEYEYLYSDECRKRSPYTGRKVEVSYAFKP